MNPTLRQVLSGLLLISTASCAHTEAARPDRDEARPISATPTPAGGMKVVEGPQGALLSEPCTPEAKAAGRRKAEPQAEVGVTLKRPAIGHGSEATPYAGHRCNTD